MDTYPQHILARAATVGSIEWIPKGTGVLAQRLGDQVLAVRDLYGVPAYQISTRHDYLTGEMAISFAAFLRAQRARAFWWGCPVLGPESSALYETFEVVLDPDAPWKIKPYASSPQWYWAETTLVPNLPAVPMLIARWQPTDVALEVGDDEALEVGTDMALSLGGTEVQDTSGNGYVGEASGDSGDLFDGVDDYVEVPDAAALRMTSGGAIAASFTADTLGGGSAGRIVDKGAWWLGLAAGPRLEFGVLNDPGGTTRSTAGSIVLGAACHVVVSFDAYGRRIFVNGEDITDSGGSLTRLPPTSIAALRIGNRSGATDRAFDGRISDLRLYARPISLQEAKAMATAPTEVIVP